MSLVQIDWRPDRRTLRKFGISILVLAAIAAAVLYWRGHPGIAAGLLLFGGVTCVFCLWLPRAALPIYWFWMGISFLLGVVVSPIVFGVFYYGLVTPIGLLGRLVGRDPLHLRRGAEDTYWRDVPAQSDKSRHERQF